MTSPVVVDGRVTREKLDELLRLGAEHAELDFKTSLDLTDQAHKLGLMKDLIGMGNSTAGGYVIIGANENGAPAREADPVDVSKFDSADLAQAVGRHLVTSPVISSQHHDVDGWAMVLIHVAPAPHHLPCIISKVGEHPHPGGKGMRVVLQEGVIYVREGTHTVAASEGHWSTLLSRYRTTVIAESRQDIDTLIRTVVESLGSGSDGPRLPPVALNMEDTTFVEAVDAHLGSKAGKAKLRRFIRSSRPVISLANPDDERRDEALTKLAYVAVRAIEFTARRIFTDVIQALHDEYVAAASGSPGGRKAAEYFLAVALRVMAVGAYIVRVEAWWAVVPLVDRPVDDYHLIWLRHAITYASRAELLSGDSREDALLLVKARSLIVRNPELRPDIDSVKVVRSNEEFMTNDVALNSLCQFDFLWCVTAKLQHLEERDGALFYPSCAALYQNRTQPMILRLATSESLRSGVSADHSDPDWAAAMATVLHIATNQSSRYNNWWSGADYDQRVASFVAAST